LTTGGGRVGRAGGIGIGDQGAETVPDADRPLAAQGGADGPDVGRLRALVIAVSQPSRPTGSTYKGMLNCERPLTPNVQEVR
jgi:hypothetical protein